MYRKQFNNFALVVGLYKGISFSHPLAFNLCKVVKGIYYAFSFLQLLVYVAKGSHQPQAFSAKVPTLLNEICLAPFGHSHRMALSMDV
jgi:hypothetical protein